MTFRARVGAAVTVLGAITFGAPLIADAASDASVSTDPTGAHVQLTRRGAWIEARAPGSEPGGSGGSGPATSCRRRWVPTKFPHSLPPGKVAPDIHVTPMPAQPGPEYGAYHVYCDGVYVDSVWLPPTAFTGVAPVVDFRAVAEQLARDLPYPAATIGISPNDRGLTGLESWFWVSGYRGPIRDVVNGLGYQVEVEAVPASVRWSFGDGAPAQPGTLGRSAPSRSDVVHTYEWRSSGGSMRVQASVRLEVRFRVNGGPWEALDPVLRSATRAYPVAESRAALVTPR